MKFTHLADCHIGSWRDPKLKDASTQAFIKAVDASIEHNADFILISGDLFNTAQPPFDGLKETVQKLKQLKDKDIPVYAIAGSHDFSCSGKTMLDILEKAGLLTNTAKGENINNKLRLKFTLDKKTGAKLTGIIGKKGGLEKEYYESLAKESLESEQGYKIFMFHSALDELKPKELKDINSQPLSFLPKNFNYYAGGHMHIIDKKQIDNYGLIAFPGPLFPNTFREIEDLGRGGYFLVNVENSKTSAEWFPIQIYNTYSIRIQADNLTPEDVENKIRQEIKNKEFNSTIVTIRIEGTLKAGRPSDINFKSIFEELYNKSSFFVMKSTYYLKSTEFEEIKVQASSVDEIEEKIIKEQLGKIKIKNTTLEKEESLVKSLMHSLSKEKLEGETNTTFENRLNEELNKLLDI